MSSRHALALALALIAACGPSSSSSGSPAAPLGASPVKAEAPIAKAPEAITKGAEPVVADEPKLYERTEQMMGTVIKMQVVGAKDDVAAPAVDAAMKEMKRLETVLSEWIPESEISQINQSAGIAPVKVGRDTWLNVQVAQETAAWSGGAFDLSWAVLHGLYKFRPGEERIPTDAELKAKLPLIGYRNILLDEKDQTVFLKKKGMKLGTGGIAKGYALDRAAEILLAAGLTDYMIFGGGQVLVHGSKHGRAWRVGIQHPRLPDYFGFLELTNASISTSGDYEHAFEREGKRWHHIIDLKTGKPVEHTTSVTVICESGFYGDAVDTAMFVMGADKTLQRIDRAPGPPMEVVMVDADMRVHVTPGLKDRLIMRMPLTNGKLPLERP